MKTKIFGLLVVLACAACIGLASCSAPVEDYTPNFVGTWELTSMDGDENSMTADDFAMLKDLGISASLNFVEDGTCVLDLFGEKREGTWEASAADAASLTLSGEEIAVALTGDTLTLTQNAAQTLVFTKASAASATADASSSASGSDEASEQADAATETADSEDTEE